MPISFLFPFLSLFFLPPLLMEDISHYIVLLELSSPYTCSSFKPSLEYLSHHLSICPITLLLQLFLSCDLPGNTIQRSTPHKCGHRSRYNTFNVVVAAFLKIFWSISSFLYVHEASLCGGNFMENYYSGLNKQLNRIQ